MEVAQLVAQLKADIAGFMADMRAADAQVAATKRAVKDIEPAVLTANATDLLATVKDALETVDRARVELSVPIEATATADIKSLERNLADAEAAYMVTRGLITDPITGKVTLDAAGFLLSLEEVTAAYEAAMAKLQPIAATERQIEIGRISSEFVQRTGPGAIPLGSGGFSQTVGSEAEYRAQLAQLLESQRAENGALIMAAVAVDKESAARIEATRLEREYSVALRDAVERVNGAIPLGTSQRVFESPTATLPASGIPNEDLRRMEIFQQHASELQRGGVLGYLLGDSAARTIAGQVERSTQSSGGGGGSFLGGLAAGMGFGGGKGIFIPGLGFGFGRRAGGGLAALGSIGGLMGFGAERVLTSTLGIAGSLGGGLLGGGLLGAGILGTTAVGMGTDLAGIGQAAGDIKKVSTDLGALQTAIRVYGRNSTQAAQAQAQLNADLGGFSPVARNAVLAASQTSQAFKAMFDKATGQAEKTGAEIINQAMQVGMKFLPTIGRFAAQNMSIIQHGLQPFFSWLQNSGKMGGLGIFTNLEQIFQNRLPTMVHAGTQAIELFTKVIDVAAQQTGGLAQGIDNFFTKWNSPANFPRVAAEVDKLIGLFRTWAGLLGSVTHLVFDLFTPAVGLGKQFAQSLTDIVNQVRVWIAATGTQNVLHSLFAAHTQQVKELGLLIQALLPLLTSVVSAFLQIEAAFASAFNNGLRPIIAGIKWLLSNPFVDKILGWAGAMFLVARASAAVMAGFSLLTDGAVIQGLRGITLGFFGVQTAQVKAAIATNAETEAIQAQTIAIGEQLSLLPEEAASTGFLARLGLTGIAGKLGPAALLAGGGFLAGGLAKNAIGGRNGGLAQNTLRGAGVGAGLGFLVGDVPGAAIGAGLGAAVGATISLMHNVPKVTTDINVLGASFAMLGRNTKDTGNIQARFATQLGQIASQARAAQGRVSSFFGIPYWHSTFVPTQAQALQKYIQNLTGLANSVQASHPKLAIIYRDLVQIAQGVHKIPSKKTVTILLRTIREGGLGPSGMIGGGDLFAYGAGAHQPAPRINLNLPRGIQMQLAAAQAGHGSVQKADAAAYAYYEALLKRHNLIRKQILAIYQAEAEYAPYQTPGKVPHATGSVNTTFPPTGAALLPASMQNMLSRAQQRAASAGGGGPVSGMTPAQLQRALAANRALHSAEAAAIADLVRRASQVNASSKQHLALEQEITALTKQQAAAQRAITADLKQQHTLAVQSHINRILGIRGANASGGTSIQQRERNMFIRALEQALGGSKHSIGVTAQALGITVGQLTRESPAELLRQMRQHGITLDAKSMAELRKIQQAINLAHRDNVKMTPAETRKITNWLQQIQQELTGTNTIKSNYIAPSARALVAGLGLSHAAAQAMIARLSSYYMHGKKVPTGGAAAGEPLPPGVGGGVVLPSAGQSGRHIPFSPHGHPGDAVVVHGDVIIKIDGAGKDGAALARMIRAELLRIQRRNGAQTRGPNAGKGVGLS